MSVYVFLIITTTSFTNANNANISSSVIQMPNMGVCEAMKKHHIMTEPKFYKGNFNQEVSYRGSSTFNCIETKGEIK